MTSFPSLPLDESTRRRVLHIVMALAIAVAFVGYFVGLSTTHTEPDADFVHAPGEIDAPDHAPRARSYRELASQPIGPNAAWSPHLAQLPPSPIDPLDAAVQTPDDVQQALARRSARRAFAGAPPVVPHPIDQLDSAACLACHAEPTRIGSIVAPQISHQHYTSCTQCHVESTAPQFRDDAATLLTPSDFTPLATTGPGRRASPGAPPTIPHTTWMRDNCAACHGPASTGLHTSHPWRHSCTQCHAPDASLDQADFFGALPAPPEITP